MSEKANFKAEQLNFKGDEVQFPGEQVKCSGEQVKFSGEQAKISGEQLSQNVGRRAYLWATVYPNMTGARSLIPGPSTQVHFNIKVQCL